MKKYIMLRIGYWDPHSAKDFLLVDKTNILDLSMVFKIAAAFVSLSTLSFAATTIKQPTICANGQVVSHEAVSLI